MMHISDLLLSKTSLAASASLVSRRNFVASLGAGALAAWHVQAYADNALLDETWVDPARNQRQIPALTRWPASAVQGVIVFSHGLGGRREGADAWGQAWVDAGFVVVHLQHAGSDAPAMRGGFAAFRAASSGEQLIARVGDVKFAIDEIERRRSAKTGRWGEIPANKLGVAGHSFGARTCQALAGMAYPKGGGWSGADARIQAFMALSPALGKGATLEQARQDSKAMTRPMLVVSGSLDGEVLGNGETMESRRMVYDALPAGKKALLWLDGADHFTFAGNIKQIRSNVLLRRDGVALSGETRHHDIVARASTHWWRSQLLGAAMTEPQGLGAQDVWRMG